MFEPSYHYYAQIAWALFKSQNKEFNGTIEEFLLKFTTKTKKVEPTNAQSNMTAEEYSENARAALLARFGGKQRTPGLMR